MNSSDMLFKKGNTRDIPKLRKLAKESEAHWGYDVSFMEVFDDKFNITDQFMNDQIVYVGWQNQDLIGFFGLMESEEGVELEYFYVQEQKLGCGIGKLMWNYMIDICRSMEITRIHFATSPQAVGFYQRMGAERDLEVKSIIDGRLIPHFHYNVK